MSGKRYFTLAPEGESKVGHLSNELRRALSLQDDMLPIWVYRMRVLGYPPVWMSEAEVKKPLNIFDDDHVQDPPGDCKKSTSVEDGEVDAGDSATKYNKEAFHQYPGFNCPAPPNVKDDWLLLGMPPMIEDQQLSKAVNNTNCLEHVPYKKRKLDNSLNTSSASKPESPKSSPASPTGSQDESADNIETTKNDDGNKSVETVDANTTDLSNEEEQEKTQEVEDEQQVVVPVEERRLSTLIAIGTPLPKERKKLPGLEKWAVGMGELLHFENLPDSVGAYERKIKGLIEKIREKQKVSDQNTSSAPDKAN